MKPQAPDKATAPKHWEGPGVEAWSAWSPDRLMEVLAPVTAPWCVVGGWAIELAIGKSYRDHSDIEISTARADFPEIAARLHDNYVLHAVRDGESRRLATGSQLPEDTHQCWVLDPRKRCWRLDIMVDPGDSECWVYRRDARIAASRSEITASRQGIRYLRPEAVLLFKARARRPKDEMDFVTCLPLLGGRAKAWLKDALLLTHPEHPWISRL